MQWIAAVSLHSSPSIVGVDSRQVGNMRSPHERRQCIVENVAAEGETVKERWWEVIATEKKTLRLEWKYQLRKRGSSCCF